MARASRIFTPENRLESALGEHAPRFEDLIAAAETRVGQFSAALGAEVDARLEVLLAADADDLETVALNARAVAELAPACRRRAVAEAARGVCALLESGDDSRRARHALRLHLDTLALLKANRLQDAMGLEVLERLAVLRAAVGV